MRVDTLPNVGGKGPGPISFQAAEELSPSASIGAVRRFILGRRSWPISAVPGSEHTGLGKRYTSKPLKASTMSVSNGNC